MSDLNKITSNAKPSCRHCYGTGIYGTKIEKEKRIKLICTCVTRAVKNKKEEEQKQEQQKVHE